MPDWSCRTCGAINLDGQRACEGCGKEQEGRPRVAGVSLGSRKPESAEPVALPPNSPAAWAQGRKAAKILQAMVAHDISAEEGRTQMAALLTMPALEREEP